MRRLVWTLGLCLCLVGCAGSNTPATDQPTAVLPTTVPTTVPSPTPDATATAVPVPSSPPTGSPTPWPAGIAAHPAGSAGNDVGVLSYMPPGYEDDDADWPLLVFLHGSEEYGDGSEAQMRKVLANGIPTTIAAGEWPAELPFIVLMPQYSFAEANGPCALNDEIESVIEWADRTYRIDRSRIYLTGISCGAIGVLDYLASSQERRVAATVPISSAPYEGPDAGARVRGGCSIARTPTWFFHGALDDIVPVHYVQNAVKELRACTDPRPKVLKLTVYPDADHDSWSRTYDGSAGHDIYGWLLDQTSKSDD